MPDHRTTQEEQEQHTWLYTACALIATWLVYGLSMRTGIPVIPEMLRVALACWRPGTRRT
ncbi:MAG: hypothetical protein WC713_05985 [Candidatus Methylomirabilota bacterium]